MDERDPEFLRKKPKQSRSRAVVDAIMTAVDEMIQRVDEDVSAISVQKVAERAGVGIGSLYDYFSNRDSLLGELVARVTRDNFAAIARLGYVRPVIRERDRFARARWRATSTRRRPPTRPSASWPRARWSATG